MSNGTAESAGNKKSQHDGSSTKQKAFEDTSVKMLLLIIEQLQYSGEKKLHISWTKLSEELDVGLKGEAARKRLETLNKKYGIVGGESAGKASEKGSKKRKAETEPEGDQRDGTEGNEEQIGDETAVLNGTTPARVRKQRRSKAEKRVPGEGEGETKKRKGRKGKNQDVAEEQTEQTGLATPPAEAAEADSDKLDENEDGEHVTGPTAGVEHSIDNEKA